MCILGMYAYPSTIPPTTNNSQLMSRTPETAAVGRGELSNLSTEGSEESLEEQDEEDMETAHTLVYGRNGAPYICIPTPAYTFPPPKANRRSSKKKQRRGYSKYPWNYQ